MNAELLRSCFKIVAGCRTDFFLSAPLPHKCAVPASFGTPHLCGSDEFCRASIAAAVAMIWLTVLPASANPKGGTVAQGTAAFNNSGSQLTVHTSDRAFINWQSFNIAPGQTTTFVQPSASSVVWNRINDPSPSQILGTLNA